MNEKIETLYELCEVISRELQDVTQKIRSSGGGMSAGDLELVDKLSHALKSIKTTIAMMESEEEEDGYSYRSGRSYQRGGGGNSRRSGRSYSYDGMSYARGRGGRGNNPTGRNQYSREGGYSYADSMDEILEEMRGMMDQLPEEKKREVQRFVDKMDRM